MSDDSSILFSIHLALTEISSTLDNAIDLFAEPFKDIKDISNNVAGVDAGLKGISASVENLSKSIMSLHPKDEDKEKGKEREKTEKDNGPRKGTDTGESHNVPTKEEKAKSDEEARQAAKDKEIKNLNNRLASLNQGILFLGLIGGSADKLSDSIGKNIDLNNKMMQVGLNSNTALDKNIVALSKNGSQIAGDFNTMELALAATESGLGKVSAGTSNLLLSQKLLGADHNATAKALAKVSAGTGMNSDQMGNLSTSLVGFSNKFGIKVDDLIGALGNLTNSVMIGLAKGSTEALMTSMAGLAAAVGPQMAGAMTGAMDELMGAGGFIQAGLLGVSDQRSAATSSGDVSELFLDAASKARSEFERMTAGGGDTAMNIGIFTSLYGQNSTTMIKLLEEMEKKAAEQGLSVEEYINLTKENAKADEVRAQGMEAFKNAMMAPLLFIGSVIASIGNALTNSPALMAIAKAVGVVVTILTFVATILTVIALIAKIALILKQIGFAPKLMAAISTVAGMGWLALIAIALTAVIAAIFWWASSNDSNDKENSRILEGIERNTKKEETKKEEDLGMVFSKGATLSLNSAMLSNNGNDSMSKTLEQINGNLEKGHEIQESTIKAIHEKKMSGFNRGSN